MNRIWVAGSGFRNRLCEKHWSACANKRFAQITSDFIAQFQRFTHISLTRMVRPQNFDALAEEHAAIVAAMRERDRRTAIKILARHIEDSRHRTIEAVATPK